MTDGNQGRRLSYALWAAFVASVAVSGVMLLPACGLLVPLATAIPLLGGWNFCPAAPLALSAETERGATLAKLARQLELELAQKSLECASIPPPPPLPLQLPTEAGPARPQQTAALKPPPPPPPPPKPEPPSPVLKLPDKPTEDYSFLKGCWRTDPFRHSPTHDPGISSYCFDEKGNGQLEFRRPGHPGYVCRAPAQARYEGQQLRIRDADTKCTDGSQWFADNLECRRGADNVAQCSGKASNGRGGIDTWTSRLNRVR